MNFKVIWRHRLMPVLASIYLDARQRGDDTTALATAVSTIDDRLKADPSHQGESRGGADRIMFVPPLVVEFEVYDEEGVVLVTTVRFISRR